MTKLLLSNDDGVFAPGLKVLQQTLSKHYHTTTLAPDRNRSGASNSLTLDRPLEITAQHNGFYSISGTPTDCVHIGMSGVLGEAPEMVVTGINTGANLGDDVLYSGTVAGAFEGRHLKYPSIAVSLVGSNPVYYQTAADIVLQMLQKISALNLAPRTILNVNVPDLPLNELKGVHITRLGHRHMAGQPCNMIDPRGVSRYWIAAAGDAADNEPGTDFFAVEQGFVSITPLQVDMTQYSAMDNLASWLETL